MPKAKDIENDQTGETMSNDTEEVKEASEEGVETKQDSLETESVEELLARIESLQKRLDEAENSATEAKDEHLRAHAEMENIRRRSERDVSHARKFALERFAQDLLPVIDSMEKAAEVKSESSEVDAMREGVELTIKMFVEVVDKFGLKQINPVDETFDPNLHEAMVMQPIEGKDPNTVIEVFQKGYELNGRVIRPARVVVSQ